METTTDRNGRFILERIPQGAILLQTELPEYVCSGVKIEVGDRESLTIEIELHSSSPRPVAEKPVIYLYPEVKQEVRVVLDYKGTILHSYPTITDSVWSVTAEPNGKLWDRNGKEFYALFWEGQPTEQLVPNDGFVVAGEDVAGFLEEKLEYLGLNRREANEFIMYWLPRMENNPFNLVHFASGSYERMAKLHVTPEPETVIRVMMLTQPLPSKIQFPLQDLSGMKKIRKGFTVVEWGGSVCSIPSL